MYAYELQKKHTACKAIFYQEWAQFITLGWWYYFQDHTENLLSWNVIWYFIFIIKLVMEQSFLNNPLVLM